MTVVIALVLVVGVVVVIGGVVALLVVLFRASARQRQRRTADLAAYAASRGFAFTATDRALPDRFAGPPFRRGSARLASCVLQGTHEGRPVLAFEYTFAVGSGDDRRRYRYTVVATALPTPVPRLEMLRSSTAGTFVDAFTGGDHRIGDPLFDAAYRLFTDSPPFAADVLAPDLRQWLMAQQPPLAYLRDGDLVVVTRGSLQPAEVERMLAYAAAFLALVPDQVWQRAARGAAGGQAPDD